jgi:hypothetical protein
VRSSSHGRRGSGGHAHGEERPGVVLGLGATRWGEPWWPCALLWRPDRAPALPLPFAVAAERSTCCHRGGWGG